VSNPCLDILVAATMTEKKEFPEQLQAIRDHRQAARLYMLYLLTDPDHYSRICALQEDRLLAGHKKWGDRFFGWVHTRLQHELEQELADGLSYGGVLDLITGGTGGK